ncbi:nose resistant to fluoxetine protein 6-like [Lycorma delicatula]|uniref:nose resistant to fluoxetine protein 6-like n=1 Tax=Lycorma delicatula TaxID=130591 RepID=UPI003F5104F0
MNYSPCLLVIFITIVHGADDLMTTTLIPGGIDVFSNDSKIIDQNDTLFNLFSETLSNNKTDDNDTVSNTDIDYNEDEEFLDDSPTTDKSPNIQIVPRRRLSTLPPLSIKNTPAILNNSRLLKGWIADEISDALWAFAPQPSSNPKCTLHGQLYRNGINNFTLWAMQMLDSSNRIPNGLLIGSVFQLGHFDECVRISVPAEDLDGKYCLTTIKFAPSKETYPAYHIPDERLKYESPDIYAPAWDEFKPAFDISRRTRDVVHWGFCVPSSCTVEDIEEALNVALVAPLANHGIDVNISLPNNKCYARREEKPYSIGFFLVLGILGLLYLIAVFGTWMDMFYYQSNRPHSKSLRKWLKPFSVYTNLYKITRANPNKEFSEFHFLKLFAISCVISGHRQMLLYGPTPNANPWWHEWTYSQFIVAFSVNGGVLVDTFFFLSGFLTCHYIYQELVKRKKLNLIAIIINRWIRIAPVYMFVMAVYGWVIPYTGDGPLWNSRIGVQSERCRKNWWINLLFLNNYINTDEMCMVQSWYLACDMHFFIIGSLIVYALWKWPRGGQIIMWFSFLVSCIIPGYITYKHKYWGVIPHYNSLFIDPVKNEQFINIYMPSHTRFGPYMIGIIGAYLLNRLQKRNYKFSVPTMIIGSLIGASLSLGAILSGYVFYLRDRPYSLVENILYAATHRSIWSIGIIWFIVAEASTGYGILYNFFKHPFFTVFGRLTYCAYLVHLLPQLIHTSSSRLPIYIDLKRMFWYSMGDFVMSYSLALGLNLLFEAPLERLQKKILKKLVREHDAKQSNNEKKFNGELAEVGIDNQAMDKSEIA